MSRLWLLLALSGTLFAQDKPVQKPGEPQSSQKAQSKAQEKEDLPPEEDESAKEQQFSFNPLKSKKDVTVGDFYLKTKKDARAAAQRYRWATKWNAGNAEAWLKLAQMDERTDVGNKDEAKEAYQKYLELAPDAKNAPDVKKKLAQL